MKALTAENAEAAEEKEGEDLDPNQVSGAVIDSAMKVHTALGPGLLESAYAGCFCHELRKRGLKVDCQVPVSVTYDGTTIDVGYRLDLWSRIW